jgi:hypothetical protein
MNPELIKFRTFGQIISCFSIITNTRKLFTIDRQKMDQNLQYIHGLRVITMVWIIVIHVFTVGTLFVPMLVCKSRNKNFNIFYNNKKVLN